MFKFLDKIADMFQDRDERRRNVIDKLKKEINEIQDKKDPSDADRARVIFLTHKLSVLINQALNK